MTNDHETITRRALARWGIAGGAAFAGTTAATATTPANAESAVATVSLTASSSSDYVCEVGTVADLRAMAGDSDGDQALLLGYYSDTPGRGGGIVYWDDTATEPDDGGMVFAVTGVSTGRWKRPHGGRIDLTWFGWRGNGSQDDSGLLQAAIDALPNGGVVEIGPGKILLQQTVNILQAPVIIDGSGHTRDLDPGTQIVIDTGSDDGFVLTGMRGGGFRNLQMQGVNLTGGSMVRTERAGPSGDGSNYMVAFSHVRFRDGYNGLTLRGCNSIRFQNCVWHTFSGEHVILLNGVDDGNRADPVEFLQCGIAAGPGNHVTDNIIVDGLGGSLKFFATAVLFGRHGLWLRNTTGSTASPKFVYFEGGGFENLHGVAALLEKGAQVQFANTYLSIDGEDDNVRIGPDFIGGVTFAGCVIRGAGRNGIDIASARTTITGCLIGNNGRTAHPAFARDVSGISSDGSGGSRVTTTAAHGWETGDRITVSDVTGATGVNGKWSIVVVDDDTFDIPDVSPGGTYTGGGEAYRHGAGVNIRSTATRVVMTGNALGGFVGDGVNRQDYGIVNESPDILVTSNDLNGNKVDGYLALADATADTRVIGNKGTEHVDGWFSTWIPGTVADGTHNFGNQLFIDGQRVMVVRVTHQIESGSCDVRFSANGSPVTGPITVTTSAGSKTLALPALVDGTGSPARIGVFVEDATSGADGLAVQFGYRIVG